MPRISAQDFAHLPLRVHGFLADVPLHDVWAVDLPRTRSGITLDEFLRAEKIHQCRLSPSARALLSVRLSIGRLLGWDRGPTATACETFAASMTIADRSKTLVPAGTPEGLFRVVYRFENEQLLELINRTAHAAALSALVETANAYRFYFGVYVRNVSRSTADCAHQNDEEYGEHDRVFPNSLALLRSQFIQVETPQAACFKKICGFNVYIFFTSPGMAQ